MQHAKQGWQADDVWPLKWKEHCFFLCLTKKWDSCFVCTW